MKKIFFALSLLAVAATASAAEFADTSVPDQMIDLGVRFGISSSNLSADIPHAGEECNFSWKRGFTAGVVMNLNIRDFFSIQPGFYFENRSYDYSTIRHDADRRALETNLGHTRRYAFSILSWLRSISTSPTPCGGTWSGSILLLRNRRR